MVQHIHHSGHVYKPKKALSGWDIRRKKERTDKHRGHLKYIEEQNKLTLNPFFATLSEEDQKRLRQGAK
jgi:hypothetical protein